MWQLIVLASFPVVGTQAFGAPAVSARSAPIQWAGLPARRYVLAAVAESKQRLKLWQPPFKTSATRLPHFTPKADKTIALSSTDLCIEAAGDKTGDNVVVNRCTGLGLQLWNFLPKGNEKNTQIQLAGSNKCIYVNDRNGLIKATVELQNCDDKVTELWKIEEEVALPTGSPSEFLDRTNAQRHVFLSFLSMVALGSLGVTAWLWRWIGMAERAARHGGMPLTTEMSGASLVLPSAAGRDPRMAARTPYFEAMLEPSRLRPVQPNPEPLRSSQAASSHRPWWKRVCDGLLAIESADSVGLEAKAVSGQTIPAELVSTLTHNDVHFGNAALGRQTARAAHRQRMTPAVMMAPKPTPPAALLNIEAEADPSTLKDTWRQSLRDLSEELGPVFSLEELGRVVYDLQCPVLTQVLAELTPPHYRPQGPQGVFVDGSVEKAPLADGEILNVLAQVPALQEILVEVLGPEHPITVIAMKNYYTILESLGPSAEEEATRVRNNVLTELAPLHWVSAVSLEPHPDKAYKGGEDAYFLDDASGALGVADGVGGWASAGVDPGLFSKELMKHAVEEVDAEKSPLAVMRQAHERSSVKGSSTALVLQQKGHFLTAANLGDSGFLIVRDGEVVFQTEAQQKGFNHPYQLAGPDCPGDYSYEADSMMVAGVRPGDVVVAATDGVLDNVFPEKIAETVAKSWPPEEGSESSEAESPKQVASLIADDIVEEASRCARDPDCYSPFEKGIKDIDPNHSYKGGKLDDITVVAAVVVDEDAYKLALPNATVEVSVTVDEELTNLKVKCHEQAEQIEQLEEENAKLQQQLQMAMDKLKE